MINYKRCSLCLSHAEHERNGLSLCKYHAQEFDVGIITHTEVPRL